MTVVGGYGPELIEGLGGTAEGGEVAQIGGGWRLALSSFVENKMAVAGFGIVIFFVLLCFLGPVFYHTNQVSTNLALDYQGPSSGHILGTDSNGFDELGRIMVGGQAALEIGFFAALIATVIGTFYGAVAGLIGGLFDGILMRIVDILLSVPTLLVILILATKYNGTVETLSIIIGIFAWQAPARLVRGEVLSLRTRDFVSAAKAMGSRRSRLINRHLIPNAMSVVIVNTTFQVADAIIAVAGLGFLGFGLTYPAASWGDMLGGAENNVSNGYWWLVYPVGIALVLVVMACNFIGDGLRDALDVRMRRR